METGNRPDRAIEAIARQQHCVVSRAQMLAAGLTPSGVKRRVRSGLWVVILPGVYRPPTVAPTKEQGAMTACLWAGPDALVSHRAAALLWRLDGVTAGRMEITVPIQSRVRNAKLTVHRTNDLIPADRSQVDGIPVTSPLRTLVDLGGCLDDTSLELAVEDAFRRGLTTPKQLGWRLDAIGGKGRAGSGVLRDLLSSRGRNTGSGYEVALARMLVRAGLPKPERQFVVRHGSRFIARVDLAYPEHRIAIEFDSVRWHTGGGRLHHESDRRRRLAAAGWHVVPVTARAMKETPADVLIDIAGILAAPPARE